MVNFFKNVLRKNGLPNKKIEEVNPFSLANILDGNIEKIDVCAVCFRSFYNDKKEFIANTSNAIINGEPVVEVICPYCETKYNFRNWKGGK